MTADELRPIVVAELGRIAPEITAETIRPGAPLRDQVDLDSMDFLHFVVALHERLGVDIPESDYARLSSIDAIATYLASREAAQRAPP